MIPSLDLSLYLDFSFVSNVSVLKDIYDLFEYVQYDSDQGRALPMLRLGVIAGKASQP